MSDEERSSSVVGDKSDNEDESREQATRIAGKKRPRVADPDEEDDEDEKEEDGREDVKGDDDKEEEEDDEDEEEEDDDEDDEDDEDMDTDRHRKKRNKKSKRNRFLDVEAVVDDDEEEADEDEELGDVAGFIDEVPEGAADRDDYTHQRVDRTARRNEEQSVEDIVQKLKERHGRQAGAKYNGDSDAVPQRLLMPGVNDPSLWQVKVKTGREKHIIASIFHKCFAQQYSSNPIDIQSVFYRDSLSGLIFIEARQSAAVSQAVSGVIGVYLSTGVRLVPIEEMAPLLRMKKKDIVLTPGMWVRMKRGKYAGDLAQVLDVEQMTNGVVGIKYIPRIDLTPRDKKRDKKGLAGTNRPPARLFQYDEVKKVYGRQAIRQTAQGTYFFENDEYVEGFCVKDIKNELVITEDVAPNLEEIARFVGDDASVAKVDLSALADANKTGTGAVLFPGDQVEVYEGELAGMYGVVETVSSDTIAIKAEGGDVHGQTVELPPKSVRKRFEVGEHVKVLTGKNLDVSGMVVEVKGDIVTLMSDQGQQEIKAFSRDVRKATDTAGSSTQAGLYDVHDLVMLDTTTSAVIVKVEGGMLRVLDQNGSVRLLSPQQVTLRRDNARYAAATDSTNNDIRVGDAMKEVDGEMRSGEVINIFRSLFVFLHNRELSENHGVFVARASALVSVTPKAAGGDLGKLNPMLQQQLPHGGASLMPPPAINVNKNRLINTLVVVVKGTSKGLMGIIKDVMGENARVELATNNKTLTINMSSLKRKDPRSGMTFPLDTGASFGGGASNGSRPNPGGYDVNPYAPMGQGMGLGGGQTPANLGGRTPAARFGQTPNPYANNGAIGGKTPNPYAGGAGGRTPGWAGSGGKTPGWGGGGKTPASGIDGGRTPGWAGAGGGKTPNPYAAGPSGGRTPAPSSGPPEWSRFNQGPISAPTPYNGPTPGMMGAPTPAAPGGFSAPTPYAAPTPYHAPTPYTAPTPGVSLSAPTPGMAMGITPHGAPTPYGAPTPFASTPYGTTVMNGSAPSGPEVVAWDWALDFRNVLVEVGQSARPGTRNPLHYQRGALDGQRFGLEQSVDEISKCVSLTDPTQVNEIPAEYLRPARPDGPGQVVVFLTGNDKGQQRTTAYMNDGQWMMEQDSSDMMALVMDEDGLCRIWKTEG